LNTAFTGLLWIYSILASHNPNQTYLRLQIFYGG